MINEREKDKITDEAWAKLQLRLEQDGLLAQKRLKKNVFTSHPTIKWAAIIILCICSAATFALLKPSNIEQLALHNGGGEPTLVTTLEDGSVVFLGELTSLHYPSYFAADKREVSLQGKAFFDISKNTDRPFFIDTELVKVEVIGTEFSIQCKDNTSFSLSVKSGEVKAEMKKSGQSIHVKAGETALLHSNSLHKTKTASLEEFSNYLKAMHFKDQRLIDVVQVINELSDSVQLKIAADVEDRLITVTFSKNSLHAMAELICIALDLHLSQQNNIVTISSKN